MKPIMLTGFMGSGKTTVGKALAEELQTSFLDADEFFTRQTSLLPPFYIKRFGIQAFRKTERLCLKWILLDPPGVLATGGGVVLHWFNRVRLLSNGFVVWVHTPLYLVLNRLHQRSLAPMLSKPVSLRDLQNLYKRREAFYKKCHFKVSNAFESPKDVALKIIQQYKTIDYRP